MNILNLNSNAPLTLPMMVGMAIATLLGGTVQSVNAQVLVSGPPEVLPPCNVGAVTFQSNTTLHQPLACAGANIGNDLALHQPLLNWLNRGLFEDFTGSNVAWEFIGQSNTPEAAISATVNQPQGHWAIAFPVQDWFVVSVATLLGYSAYLFDAGPTPITIGQGSFNTLGISTNFTGAGHNLRRISLFTPLGVEIAAPIPNPGPGAHPHQEPVAVPEPGTILGSVLVLAGLRWFRQRL
ncbi:MAG: hypothetical protein EA366_02820 [Spirulina sp. DLM2.Bin59]|nr:MAG: hypothetical protein EA366_02820 [Spirulina sp. DLM2.Bin59]